MPGLSVVAEELGKLRSELDAHVAIAKKNIAVEAVEFLTSITQVDTSKAISNYRIANGVPPTDEEEPHFPGHHGSTAQLSQAISNEIAQGWPLSRPGEEVVVFNNVDYLDKINRRGGDYLGQARESAEGAWLEREETRLQRWLDGR